MTTSAEKYERCDDVLHAYEPSIFLLRYWIVKFGHFYPLCLLDASHTGCAILVSVVEVLFLQLLITSLYPSCFQIYMRKSLVGTSVSIQIRVPGRARMDQLLGLGIQQSGLDSNERVCACSKTSGKSFASCK